MTPTDATALPGRHLLQLSGIEKTFLTEDVETRALAGLDLSVRQGEWVSIVGPSGSGKTTLLAILGLLDAPTRGEFLLDGRPVQDLTPQERAHVRNKHIGFVFQSFNLIGDLTVLENVELPLAYRGMPPSERRQRAEAALARVGLAHRGRHMPGQLSGGQQQRVAVARAVAGEPLLLLADEPTGNLDSRNGQDVMRLLADLHASGSTILMVTHDAAYARLGTRAVTLFDGRILDETTNANGASRPAGGLAVASLSGC